VGPLLTALTPSAAAEKQVVRKLGLSPYTINGYVKDLYRRFGVNSRRVVAGFDANSRLNVIDSPSGSRSRTRTL
jgi:hypothetical protein